MLARAGCWATAVQNAVATSEGNKYVRTTRFVSIGSGTSGTVTLPLNAEVVLDDFGGTVDAVVLQISGGKPTALPALTSTGVVVATTFDASGNWAFSGTPVSYPVALVYRVQTKLGQFDSTSSDIWGDAENIGVNTVANGGTGLSSFSVGDIIYASATRVLSALAANATGTKKFLSMTSSSPAWAQPAFTDITGTVAASQLPTPGASALGGVKSLAAVSHQWINSIGTDGTPTQTQPAFSDISGVAAGAQIPIILPTSGDAATMWAATGTDGQFYWNTDYKLMFYWTGRWVPLKMDPRCGTEVFDEFNGTDRIGQIDWQTNGSSPATAGSLLSPGIYKLSISAASNLTYLTTQLNSIQLGSGLDMYLEAMVSIDQLSDGTNNLAFAFGLNDGTSYSSTSACTDGVYLRYDNATNTNKWICNTSSNSSVTGVNSNTAITAATFYRLGILIQGTASAKFFVNGTQIDGGSGITTNLPTGAGRQSGLSFRIDKQLGAGAVTVSLDYVSMQAFFNGARRVA